MNIYKNFDGINFKNDTIITVGTFDGVHLGHQMIIEKLLEKAQEKKLIPVLITFDPHPQIVLAKEGKNPLKLDSKAPKIKLQDYIYTETRYKMLTKSHPERAKELLDFAQEEVLKKWSYYEQMAGMTYSKPTNGEEE